MSAAAREFEAASSDEFMSGSDHCERTMATEMACETVEYGRVATTARYDTEAASDPVECSAATVNGETSVCGAVVETPLDVDSTECVHAVLF